MATEPLHFISAEDYLKLERVAPYKSEYRDGQMYAMSGASFIHTQISFNLSGELWSQLRSSSSDCRVAGGDLRVHIPATGLYTYPDLVGMCGQPKFIDAELDTLLNPVLIIEILSKTTRNYDRGDKFVDYRSIPSLTEYLTVAQDKFHVEQFNLIQGHWTLTEYRDPNTILNLQSLSVEFPLGNIYAKTGVH